MARPPEDGAERLVHATAVSLAERAVLIRGPSGSGKSDLALRFLTAFAAEGARLVSDDQTIVRRRRNALVVRAPEPISGLIEIRGVGLVEVPYREEAALRLLIDLVAPADVPRLPPEPAPHETFLGLSLPVLKLAPFEASAHIKLRLALAVLR